MIALLIFHQKGKFSAFFQADSGPDQRADTNLATGFVETGRTINAVSVEQGNSRVLQPRRLPGKLFRQRSTFQKTEGAAGFEFDVHWLGFDALL